MWVLLSILFFFLGAFGFLYVFGTVTSELDPSTGLKIFIEVIAYLTFLMFICSSVSMIMAIYNGIKLLVNSI